MDIKVNPLLPSNPKQIQMLSCGLSAVEGPQIVGKIGLQNLSIGYDSQYTSRLTLNSGATDQPLLYGFLGKTITFIFVKASYTNPNPYCNQVGENYLTWYFVDSGNTQSPTFNMCDIMILSGQRNHRLDQIYFNNPTGYKVTLDVMCANLEQPDISPVHVKINVLNNLYYNSIVSDFIQGVGISGSTQFKFNDINDDLLLAMTYDIVSHIRYSSTAQLILATIYGDNITLNFVNDFHAKQAQSRMQWVLEKQLNRHLTKTSPTLDTVPPVIYELHTESTHYMSLGSGITILDLADYFISGITDDRDGIMNKYDAFVYIEKVGYVQSLSSITEDGSYNIIFSAVDIASNTSTLSKSVIVDSIPPVINFLNSANPNRMDLTGDTTTPGLLKTTDISTYYIYKIIDNVDGEIPVVNMTTTITSGLTTYTGITDIGYYTINFSIADFAGNVGTATKTLHAVEGIAPLFIINPASTGNTISSGFTGLTMLEVVDYYVLQVVDNADGVIPNSSVTISDLTFPITTIGYYNGTLTVEDSCGNIATESIFFNVF